MVDPTLANKVKITVIATGFDHVRIDRSTPANAPMQTPVDMTAYSSQLRADRVRAAADCANRARPSRAGRRSRCRSRRRGPWRSVRMPGEVPLGTALPGEFDLNLDLDVPAFLRRSEG